MQEVKSSIHENTISLNTIKKNIFPKISSEIISVNLPEKNKIILKTFSGMRGRTGNQGIPGSGINAEQIQGINVSSNIPLENQVLVFDGEQYIPKFYCKPTYIQLTTADIFNGYTVIDTPAVGSSGEKFYVEMSIKGFPEQVYGLDFTAINVENTFLIIIWKTEGEIVGIVSPIYPTNGLSELLIEGDILKINYHY